MPKWSGGYDNPFYHNVGGSVKGELAARATQVGTRVRGGKNTKAVEWSYGKTAYGHVNGGGIPLGFPGDRVMSDKSGALKLYSSNNLPRFPLLTSMDVTNDGTIGSLLRGNFSFSFWPEIGAGGFSMKGVDSAYFVPGKEVKMSWGWSYGGPACKQAFTGIISNFNWSFNADLSLSATVSIVSAATIAVGASGDQSTKSEEGDAGEVKDPAQVVVEGNNLASIIDADLGTGKEEGTEGTNGEPPPPPPPPDGTGGAGIPNFVPTTAGETMYLASGDTVSKMLDYVGIGWPYQESDGEEEEVEKPDPPPPPPESAAVKPFWYVNVYSLVDFANKIIEKFEGGGGGLGTVFKVAVEGNMTQKLPIQSAFPIDVVFPDPAVMGKYGDCVPQYKDDKFLAGNDINIGGILVGTDYIKETFKKFIQDNSANVFYKNLTSWFETLLKRINVASGEMYQLTPVLCEPPSNFDGNSEGKLATSILSIEDSNLSSTHTNKVTPLKFTADIYRPLIKSVNISSKPPAPMAAAAYVKARGSNKAANIDVKADAAAASAEEGKIKEKLTKAVENFSKTGFNDAWCEAFRGNLAKLKKMSSNPADAHWLNMALYPVDFSVTIDGVSGFRFGDVISTNLVPSKYVENKLVFVITKIEHRISGGMWETTLHTAARLAMDGKGTL